jgi:SHS2 domain-containing protein
MPYRYLDHIATADVAFEAKGASLEELFHAAADATLHVMIENPNSIKGQIQKKFEVKDTQLDLLLLQELIFHKDANQLFLRVVNIRIEQEQNLYHLWAQTAGEKINPARHEIVVDVKAVTLHRLSVQQNASGWVAVVVLDI